MKRISVVLFAGMLLLTCCRNPEQNHVPEQEEMSSEGMKESLINQSRTRMREEVARIDSWIDRHQVQMESSNTGVRFRILEKGTGPVPALLSKVSVDYKLGLLDGTECYNSESNGKLEFILGQSAEPSGLQEILLKLNEGSRAQIIVPSYLGYGLTGDGGCIPGDQSLLYEIRLTRVQPN